MAKPNQPKDIKPKAEGESANKKKVQIDENMKVIIINLVTTVLICILFLSVNYVLQASLLSSTLSKHAAFKPESEEYSEDADVDAAQHGFILDLGDFILNLSDISPRKYLKVNVALEVSNKPEDLVIKKESNGGHGSVENTLSPLESEMAQFKPAIRDAVITTLSSKTSAELSSVAGKELAKDQISESVNGIFAGNREVLRVSFGQFIIQ